MMELSTSTMSLSQSLSLLASGGGPLLGKAAFLGVFVLLLVWLILMPGRLLGVPDAKAAWWRSPRLWAIGVTVVQIAIYLRWG